MKKGWKILIAVLVILFLIVFVAKLIIGSKIKPIIEKEASKVLGVPVHIGGIRLGFLTGDLGVNDFWIDNPTGFSKDKLFSFDAFGVKVSYPALLQKKYVINQVYLKKPQISVEMLSAKKNNLTALLEKMPKKKVEKKEEKPLPEFLVKNISVSGGRLKLADATFSAPAVVHSIDNFKFNLDNLTNMANPPKNAGSFKLSAALDRKSPINLEGKISPFDKKVSFDVRGGLKNIILTDFASYYKKAPVSIENGQADAALTLDCLKEILSGMVSVQVRNFQASQKTGGPVSGLTSNLAEGLKDDKGLIAFNFKIAGSLKKPIIGFMEAINRLTGNLLGNVARKVGEKVAEEAKSKAIHEATKGIKIGF